MVNLPSENVQNLAHILFGLKGTITRNAIINSMCKYKNIGLTGSKLPTIQGGCYNITARKASFGKSHTIKNTNKYSNNTIKANLQKIKSYREFLEKLKKILFDMVLSNYKKKLSTAVSNKNKYNLLTKLKFNENTIRNNAYAFARTAFGIKNEHIYTVLNKVRHILEKEKLNSF